MTYGRYQYRSSVAPRKWRDAFPKIVILVILSGIIYKVGFFLNSLRFYSILNPVQYSSRLPTKPIKLSQARIT